MEKRRVNFTESKSIVLLAAGLVMTVAWAIGATDWTKGLNIVTLVGLGSILISLMLARSVLPGLIAHLFSAVIGVAWSFWVTSRLLPADYTWLERWQNLVMRLTYWYNQARQGGTSYDNLMFILQMAVIVWGTGYLIMWFLLRSGKVWQAIVPGGIVLLINLYYAPSDITVWFLLYLMLALLLAIRFNLFTQEAHWRAEGTFFRPDISFDFLRDGFIFSVLVIALAWLLPPVVDAKSLGLLDEFQGSWFDLQQEWNRMYADLNYRNPGAADAFGRSLALGGPRKLTNDPVMTVKVEGGAGRYWRAAVYDEYTGLGWRNTDSDTAQFGPEAPLSLAVFEGRVPITQTYSVYHDGVSMLYSMGQPIGLSRTAKVTYHGLSSEQALHAPIRGWSGNQEPWVEEITYIRSNSLVHSGDSYQVVSAGSQATIEQLRAAGTNYPDWIADRYLQLPESVSQRTRQLARDITGQFANPFDQARAIEGYLRTNLKYNEKMAAPPANVDKVDYVLFETKEAYCDYYASAMIVMLRSLGIPARLAAGFAQGKFDPNLDAYLVTNAEAHSWVEVYFPRYGWIEFEPTAAQPTILRPTAPLAATTPLSSTTIPNSPEQDRLLQDRGNVPIDQENVLLFDLDIPFLGQSLHVTRTVVNWGLALVGLAALALVATGGVMWWRQRAITTESIFKLYQHMVTLASWMGITLRPWQTPYEHAAILEQRLPSRKEEIGLITTEYVYQTFSPIPVGSRPGGPDDPWTEESNHAWHRLRPDMLKAALRQLLRLPRLKWPRW